MLSNSPTTRWGLGCRRRKQIQLEPRQLLDYYGLAFRESACPTRRAADLNRSLLRIDPDLNHSAISVLVALALNLRLGIVGRDHLEGNVGRKRQGADRDPSGADPFPADQGPIGAAPVASSHGKRYVGSEAYPLRVGAHKNSRRESDFVNHHAMP